MAMYCQLTFTFCSSHLYLFIGVRAVIANQCLTPRESICCQEIDQILNLLVGYPKIVETASALRCFCAGIPISSQNQMPSVMKHSGSKCLEHKWQSQAVPVAPLVLNCSHPLLSHRIVSGKFMKVACNPYCLRYHSQLQRNMWALV